jgi:hypothetical protein
MKRIMLAIVIFASTQCMAMGTFKDFDRVDILEYFGLKPGMNPMNFKERIRLIIIA